MAKVLIADDNRFFRQMLRQKFSCEAEFQVCGEAENGKQAVEQAVRLQPDIIVLDVVMPIMNGVDAARVLRVLMPSVTIIMNSVETDRLTEQQARVIGITEIVGKSGSVLLEKAREALYRDPPNTAVNG